MNDGIKVVSVTPIEGEAIAKNLRQSKGFYLPVWYVLEDGRKARSDVFASRKKDLPRNLAWEKSSVCGGNLRCTLDAAGNVSGTITSINL